MDRPSRRAAAGRDAGDTNTSSSSLRHRRRHNASRTNSTTSASQSDDDGDTDASSVAPHDASTSSNTRTASKKLMPPRDAKKRASQRESENPAVDENGAADADGEADDDDELDDEEDEQSGNESRGPSAGGSEASGKRERSMSNVSTTSSSSSVASERDDRNLETMHVEKLKELEKKKQMVEDGTLAEFCRRVTEFKEERNQLLETAEWHKNLQLKNSEDLYGFEVQRAHDLWEQGKEALKGSLLQQVDALVLKLTQELADLSQVANGATEEATDGDAALEATEQEGTASEPDSETTTRTKGTSARLARLARKRKRTRVQLTSAVVAQDSRPSRPSGEKSALLRFKRRLCACLWTTSTRTSQPSWATACSTQRTRLRDWKRRLSVRPVAAVASSDG